MQACVISVSMSMNHLSQQRKEVDSIEEINCSTTEESWNTDQERFDPDGKTKT